MLIHPTPIQKTLIRKCFDGHRFFYNKAIEEINSRYEKRKTEFQQSPTCVHCTNPKEEGNPVPLCKTHSKAKKVLPWKLDINLISLRNSVMTSDKNLTPENEWQKEIPYDTRQLAIKQAVSAYNSAVSNKVRGNITHFKMGYLSRKNPRQLFWIDKTALKIKEGKVSLFVSRLKKDSELMIKRRDRRHLPEQNMTDCKLLYDRGKYYLVLTLKEKMDNEPVQDRQESIALDPGVRTFQTGFSPSGQIYKFGENQIELIKKLHNRIDKLRSALTSEVHNLKSKTKYNIKKRLQFLHRKAGNIIDNLHNQIGSLLSKNYEVVLLPEFGTSKMQTSETLCSTTKRRMNSLSHYRFQQKLSYLCQKNKSKLLIVDESYTTRTCGACGFVKEDVGSDKVFTCNACSYQLDRDIHGARNIWLKSTMTR